MRGTWLGVIAAVVMGLAGCADAQAINQSGAVVPFHVGAWFRNGVLADGGTVQVPFVDALGMFNGPSCPFGISSQTTPGLSTAAHSEFSICQTAAATTLNFLGVNGGATPSVYFNIGGTLYPFPGPGGGDVLGPLSSKINDVACYASTSGTLIADCGPSAGGVSVTIYGAVGDGAHDDTTAIQTAINTGLPLYFPPGIYKTTATLTVESYTNNGQVLRGGGSYYSSSSVGFSSTPPPGTAVIRPSAAVTTVFRIDGTPIGGAQTTWVQGFGIENLAIDMVNMTDDSSHVAINQIQAWDCHYNQVRVLNDGASKRAWLFNAGAFTTQLQNTQGNILEFAGTSSGFGVTTINVLNHDGGKVIANYAGDMRFIGGTFQGSGTKFRLRNTFDAWIEADVEGTGTYLDVDSSVSFLHSTAELQGFSGTYMAGTPAPAAFLWDQQTNFNTYPSNFTQGYVNLNNQGAAGASTMFSGAVGSNYYLGIGRTGLDTLLGTAASANDFLNGTAAGDSVISGWAAAKTLWIGAAQTPIAKATPTGFYTFGTGTLNESVVNATGAVNAATFVGQPGADGQMFTLENHAGTAFAIGFSSATVGNSYFSVGNGANILGFSDSAFSVQTFNLDGATGNLNLAGSLTTTGDIVTTGALVSEGTGGVGYSTGAGGAVTQATSKSTGVTLNKTTGAITMNAEALGSATSVMFTLTNSTIAASDTVLVNIRGGATSLAYLTQVEAVADGSANIVLRNVSGGSLSQAVVLNFTVIKGSAS